MALALNSSHPLFGNILAFVCPNEANNAIVDLKVPSRVITPTGGTFTFGSGAYGRSINPPQTNAAHLAVSPTIAEGVRTSATYTVMVVSNNTPEVFGGGNNQPQYFAYASSSESMTIDKTGGFLAYSKNPSVSPPTVITNALVLAAGAYSAVYTYAGLNAGNAVNLYHNGVFKSSGSPETTSPSISIGALHSKQAFTWHTTEYAYIVVFNKVLTATEISDLHASLGANNQFALLDSAPATTAYTLTTDTVSDTHSAGAVTLTYVGSNVAYTLTADPVTDTHNAEAVALTYSVASLPTFTSDPLKDNTNGNLLINEPLDYVALYDNTSGDLVLRVTGLSTDASGVFSVQDAALTAAVTYKADWKVTSQAQGRMPSKAAV